MVTFIPGPEALLAPAAREITQGVMHFLNPNREFQRNMQIQLATNPELLQNLADIEHRSPGTMDMLGFGGLSQIIQQIPESVESEVRRKTRGDVVRGAQFDIKNAAARSESLNKALEGFADEIAKNSNMSRDQALQYLLGQTGAQRRIQEAQATTAEASASVAGDVAAATGAQARRQAQEINQTIIDLPEIGRTDLYELARGMRAGTLDQAGWNLVSSVYRTEGPRQTFEAILSKLQRDAELAAQKELYNTRTGASEQDRLDSLYWQRAAMHHMETNAGSISAWHRYLRDPTARTRAAELEGSDPATLSFDDRELLEVHNAQVSQREHDMLNRRRRMNEDFILITNRINEMAEDFNIKDGKDPRISPMLTDLNQMLAARGAITGTIYRAEYGKVPGSGRLYRWGPLPGKFQDIGLYFTDAEGNVVDPNEVMTTTTDTGGPDANVIMTITNLQALPDDERRARLEELKVSFPDHYNDVVKQTQAMGLDWIPAQRGSR